MFVRFLSILAIPIVLLGGKQPPRESSIDRIIRESAVATATADNAGSLWTASSPYGDLAADLRPRRVNDLVTIVVVDRASALARGTVRSNRAAEARGGIQALAGTPPLADRLRNLVGLSGESALEGEGQTSRETVLRTTLSARVTHVLPNGVLVVEGQKTVRVNSELQTVTVRGLLRPFDVSTTNVALSDSLAELEVAVDGKGVVGDAIRRPNFLYRLLLGILPF